jgi:hypothetical protein
MSLFSWISFGKSSRSEPESSGLSRPQPVLPANRKGERMAQRELLYALVRACMAKAGVLSAHYKFKVLSLDGRGRQFLIMVDLARDHGMEASRLVEIEAAIAQAAKSRHDILVSAVYWRATEQAAPDSAAPPPAAAAAAPDRSRFDPIQSDEVAAFKKALAEGVAHPAAATAGAAPNMARTFDGSSKHGPQSYTLLTGFEDTELPDAEMLKGLSRTQYGELN